MKTYQKMLDWCIVKYGMSQYFDDYPDLDIDYEEMGILCGLFDDENNLITIYDKMMGGADGLELAIQTMIHEYQHYLQDPNDKSNEPHNNLMASLGFAVRTDEDICEREAERIAIRDWKECYKDLFGRNP